MMESLNVIALISGGKDSFFSLLHCLRNGHTVAALGNLYPPSPSPTDGNLREDEKGEERDWNSFMYQTVGHTVVPLYAQALGIPLYRQVIQGGAVKTGVTYVEDGDHGDGTGEAGEVDETESLIPLLQTIMKAHPNANALSTGAILSTYQRTRVESVALRLGLIPLAFLWQYPCLPPHRQIALLEDMDAVGLEARIVKVASGGLDEGFLWEDVVSVKGRGRVERAMSRFGREGDGGVIGEGGEFETLVLDGPIGLFRGRIVVGEEGRRVVREGGGAAWLGVEGARVEMKEVAVDGVVEGNECRIPELLDERFAAVLKWLEGGEEEEAISLSSANEIQQNALSLKLGKHNSNILTWTFGISESTTPPLTISEEASQIITSIQQRLTEYSLNSTHIISTVIILCSMNDFAAINKIYSTLFPHPNPPSRVTISSGSLLPTPQNLLIHLTISPSLALTKRKALHVQSRSYWAPANIGPYSQAISYPLLSAATNDSNDESLSTTSIVKIAGQIPLIPASMLLPSSSEGGNQSKDFELQTVLALQHLWRIGVEMGVRWWVGAVAFIPSTSSSSSSSPSSLSTTETQRKAKVVFEAWKAIHHPPTETDHSEDEEEEEVDLWEAKYRQGSSTVRKEDEKMCLPDWSLVVAEEGSTPPLFVAEVEELPRGSGVEWCSLNGVAGGGSVELITRTSPNNKDWKIAQTIIDKKHIYTILTIYHASGLVEMKEKMEGAMEFIGVSRKEMGELGCATYLDVGVDGIWEDGKGGGEGDSGWKGMVPCRSIWDGEGRRVGGVWVLEGVV